MIGPCKDCPFCSLDTKTTGLARLVKSNSCCAVTGDEDVDRLPSPPRSCPLLKLPEEDASDIWHGLVGVAELRGLYARAVGDVVKASRVEAELRAEVERLTWERDAERRGRETGQRLLRGLDATRATEQRRALEYGEAKAVERLHPQVDSERAANAALTSEVERLTRTIDRLHVARDALSLIYHRTSEPWAREVAARVLAEVEP